MTAPDDPTRSTGPTDGGEKHPEDPETRGPSSPEQGGAPHAERRDSERTAAERRPQDAPAPLEEPARGGRTAGTWIGLILGAIILVLLLIFVIQNNVTAGFQYFGAQFDLPLGVAMLLAAIAGALVMALVGSVRMIQMSWTIRKLRKQQEKIHRASR